MRRAAPVAVTSLVAALAATCLAQLVRDRALWLAMLMYAPVWPLAATAVVVDARAPAGIRQKKSRCPRIVCRVHELSVDESAPSPRAASPRARSP